NHRAVRRRRKRQYLELRPCRQDYAEQVSKYTRTLIHMRHRHSCLCLFPSRGYAHRQECPCHTGTASPRPPRKLFIWYCASPPTGSLSAASCLPPPSKKNVRPGLARGGRGKKSAG